MLNVRCTYEYALAFCVARLSGCPEEQTLYYWPINGKNEIWGCWNHYPMTSGTCRYPGPGRSIWLFLLDDESFHRVHAVPPYLVRLRGRRCFLPLSRQTRFQPGTKLHWPSQGKRRSSFLPHLIPPQSAGRRPNVTASS